MLMAAVRGPVTLGAKLIVMLHVLPVARDFPTHVLVWVKSPAFSPPAEILLTVRLFVPLFVRVTVWALPVDPTVTEPKVRHGEERITGYAGRGWFRSP